MNKKFTLLFLLISIVTGNALAARVTETQARALAGQFFNVTMPDKPATMKKLMKGAPSATAFYVFNNPKQPGWVVIAGDDRARTVLAYGDEDYFNNDDVPECVQEWLNGYAEQIEDLDGPNVKEPESTQTSVITAGNSKIAPLLSSKWAQSLPYNQQCPIVSGSYSPAGCVAIAMAQIMYYYKSNYGCLAIPAYTSETDDLTVDCPALPATTFNWSIINPWYDDASSSSNSAKEVQKLIKYCGQAVEMQYGKKSSGATSDRNAFVYYFGYDKYSQQINREDVNASTWENCIYNELVQGRPVFIRARKLVGGHAFICDGYDGAGLYHINWGWRGKNNGFFALNALSDGNTGGTGAASGEEGYTIGLQIIIGLEPSTSSQTHTDYNVASNYGTITTPNGTSYSRSGSSVAFNNVTLIANYCNYSCQTYTYDFGWALYNSSGSVVSTHTVSTNYSLQGGHYTYPTASLSLAKGITSGTYYLKPICRISGTSAWHPIRGSGTNYVKATITSTKLTLQVYDDLSVQNLTINSVTTGSVKKVGSPLELKLGVSNNGLTDYNYIYMWVNGTLTSATTTDIAIGSSGTVTMYYTPSQSGTNTFKFTADKAGTKTLKTTNISVNATSDASLNANNSGTLTGTTLNVKSVLTNTGSSTYNDYIIARLYKTRPNSGTSGWADNSIAKTLYLNSGGTSTLNFAFTGLEHGTGYFVFIYYYSNGELVRVGYSTSLFTPNRYDINEDGAVTSADVTAIYNYMLNGDYQFMGYSDTNSDGAVTSADITALYDYILGQ